MRFRVINLAIGIIAFLLLPFISYAQDREREHRMPPERKGPFGFGRDRTDPQEDKDRGNKLEKFRKLTPEQRNKLEKFRKLSPEQRQKLGRLLKAIQSLSPEEKKVLFENIKKFREMPQDKRKKLKEFGDRFKKFSDNKGMRHQMMRRNFLEWLKKNVPKEKLQKMKELPPEERRERIKGLMEDFKKDMLKRAAENGFIPKEKIEELKNLPPEEKQRRLEEFLKRKQGGTPPDDGFRRGFAPGGRRAPDGVPPHPPERR